MKRFRVLLLLCLLVLGGCTGEQTLELYILPAERVNEQTMTDAEIGKVALQEGRLALRGEDFSGVDWEQQMFAVKSEASVSVSVVTSEHGGSSLLKTTGDDLFVWMLDGKAVYVGGFERGTSSVTSQRSPYIKDRERYIFSVLSIGEGDIRFNKKLYSYFHSHDLIKSQLD
ncbi:MAG: hypothetical protein IKY33_01170 [Clostridia bacterium]|nr:hypothetical protein [Clostridia bacterium]